MCIRDRTRTFNAKANYQLMRFEELENFDTAQTTQITQAITSSDNSQITQTSENGVLKDFDWSTITG